MCSEEWEYDVCEDVSPWTLQVVFDEIAELSQQYPVLRLRSTVDPELANDSRTKGAFITDLHEFFIRNGSRAGIPVSDNRKQYVPPNGKRESYA